MQEGYSYSLTSCGHFFPFKEKVRQLSVLNLLACMEHTLKFETWYSFPGIHEPVKF